MSLSSNVGGTIMPEWDHAIACGIAQYDTDAASVYPYIETGFCLDVPPLEDPGFKSDVLSQTGKWRWLPLSVGIEELPECDRACAKKWLETTLPGIIATEKKRSQALRALPLTAFRDVQQLDFTGMGFSEDEIVERVNAATRHTIINVKGCQISDVALARMQLSPTLKKLILTYNPLTEKSLQTVASARLAALEVLCAAHTCIPPQEAIKLSTKTLRVFV
jgi:hypothetical protein